MKKIILEFMIIIALIVLEKMKIITFSQACIIYVIIIAMDMIIQELVDISAKLEIIRGHLQEIRYEMKPHFFNCRHNINPYFESEEDKN